MKFLTQLLIPLTMASPADQEPRSDDVERVAQNTETPLSVDAPMTGALEPSDMTLRSGEYVDWYTLDCEPGDVLSIDLDSTEFDTYLMVRAPGLSRDNDDRGDGSTNSHLNVTLGAADTARIGVTSYQPGETGSYNLVATVTGNPTGGAVVNAGAGAGGGTGRLELSDPTDPRGSYVDSYTFEAEANQTLTATVRSSEFDTLLRVTGPAFSTENDDAPGMGLNSAVSTALPSAGTYTIQVTSYEPGATGMYSLDWNVTASTGAGASTVETLALGQTLDGSLDYGDGQLRSGEFEDSYEVQLSAGDRVSLSMTSEVIDPYLILVGPDGFRQENDDREQGDFNSEVIFTAPATGTYRVVATSYAPGESGSYQVALTSMGAVDVTSATVATDGTVTSGTLSASDPTRATGQFYRVYSFEGGAGDRAVVAMSSTDFDTYLSVRMPNGYEETNDDVGEGNFNSRLNLNLPVDGTYEVWATSYAPGATGRFDLAVSIADLGGGGEPSVASTATVGGELAVDTPLQGSLEGADSALDTGEYFDTYTVIGQQGQGVTIAMDSGQIDTYLFIRGPSGFGLDNDDAPGEGTNSRLEVTFPQTGSYTVYATSYAPRETGSYTIELTEGTGLQNEGSGEIVALLAGISDYGGRGDLPYCADDAEKLFESLAKTDILSSATMVMTDRAVTRAGIQNGLSQAAAQVGPDDVFIFFYSGHGSQLSSTSELDSYDETLYVVDGHITDDELNEWLSPITARMQIIALDSCFSGGFARDVVSVPGRMGIFSSEEDVTSNVASRFNAGGYLSYFLRTGIEGEADMDPIDGVITAGELTQYLRRQWADNMMNERTETTDAEGAFQNLVIERGSIKVSDIVVYTPQR